MLLLFALVSQAACLYGFAGGGLPPNIRTIAILPFDNQTVEPALTQEVFEAVRSAMEGRLGLRQAGESNADAIVRGTITAYQPAVPLSFQRGNQANANVNVTRRLVQITVSVEILDQTAGSTLWQRSGIRVEGEYEPPDERRGREIALERLVADIVNGAQSQW